jgi:AcrR family transcriptional regulator
MTAESQEPTLRDRLLDAGRSVFADCGYAAATVDDIIAGAAVSRATFYRYFKSKDDLFRVLSRSCFDDLTGVVAEFRAVDADLDGRRALEELIARFGAVFARQGGVIRAYFERRVEPGSPLQAEAANVLGAFVDAVAQSIKQAAAPSDVDPELQAALLFLLLSRSYEYATSRYSTVDPDRLATTLAAMVHRAYYGASPEAPAGRLRVGRR